MSTEITMHSVLNGRHATYGMLARLYKAEVDEGYFQKMKAMRCPTNTGNVEVDAGYRLFHSYLSSAWERSLEDLARDYFTVFIGANTTGYSAAYPNESVHTSADRLIMQDARDEVMAIYRAAGLMNDEEFRKSGEDHIATELEYMQIMSRRAMEAWDSGDEAACASALLSQYHFLEDHLLNWTSFLTQDMLKFAKTDFYRALAHLTSGFLQEDKAFLENVIAEEIEMEREFAAACAGEGDSSESAPCEDGAREASSMCA